MMIKIDTIKRPRRKIHRETVDKLKASISVEGLRYAILLNKNKVLFDGLHRLIACEELGHTEIECEIKE